MADPVEAIAFTVQDAMIACGIDNESLFEGAPQTERIASDLFDDDFTACMDKTYEDLDDDLKGYSVLTQAQGQIRLTPGTKKNLKAFIQWTRDCIRLGQAPTDIPFPQGEAIALLRRYKTHVQFVSKSKTLATTALPEKFTSKIKWEDWAPSFLNFLRIIPGRDGVPLKYVCRNSSTADPTPHPDFLDDYVAMASLQGAAFVADAAEVHTYIVNFIAGNNMAESKIQMHADANDGRRDFIALKEHYEGVGVNAIDVVQAEKVIETLHYTGEKKPHMWWEEFEKQLTSAFTTCDRKEARTVYSNDQKLRILLKKANADFLGATRSALQLDMTRTPMTLTYDQALANFRNEVNRKFPPDVGGSNRARRISQADQGRGRGRNGRGRNGRGGRSNQSSQGGRYGRRGGRGGRGGNPKKQRQDSSYITLTDGTPLEYHPSFHFADDVFRKFKDTDKAMLQQQRAEYKALRSRQSSQVSYASHYPSTNPYAAPPYIIPHPTQISQMTQGQPYLPPYPPQIVQLLIPPPPHSGGASHISQITQEPQQQQQQRGTMFGGRNEQTNQRRRIEAVHSKRMIQSVDGPLPTNVEPLPGITANNETDSNADTCCLGTNFVIKSYTGRSADVYPYDKAYKPITNVPIVAGATAYDDPITHATFILVFHEALFYGKKLDHSLINPNQVRANGIPYWDNPYDHERGLSIQADSLSIPLSVDGTKIQFSTRSPTAHEMSTCPHIEMTSPIPWEPQEIQLGIASTGTGSKSRHEDQMTSDEIILKDMSAPLVNLRELLVSKIRTSPRKIAVVSLELTDEEVPSRRSFITEDRHVKITADTLSERFCIGPERAKATLKVTTQRGTRSAILPLSRRYKADRMFNRRRLDGRFATDTLWSTTRSLTNNIASQVYSHKCGFNATYHMRDAKGDSVGHSLTGFTSDYGIPDHLTFDGAMVQTGANTLFMKNIRRSEIKHHVSSPYRPNENPAEGSIRELKKRLYRIMMKKKIPRRLWDFCLTWVCETGNVTVSSSRYANGRTPLEIITGETPDITEYLDFAPYDWVVYKSNAGVGAPELARWLGVSHRVGPLMSYWILPASGIPVSATTVQRLTHLEKQTDEWQARTKTFDDKIEARLEAQSAEISKVRDEHRVEVILDLDNEDPEFLDDFNRVINNDTIKDIDETLHHKSDAFDTYLHMEVGLPRGDDNSLHRAQVKRRHRDESGDPIGEANNNPLLDSREYEVVYLDGEMEIMSANVIAENLLSQVDEEGHLQMMLEEITDHRCDGTEIKSTEGYYMSKGGHQTRKRTTRGWQVYLQWKDGSGDWVAMKDVKDSYPIELAEYAIAASISHEPAFAWWVPYTIRKRARIISKLKTKYWKKTHKYGFEIPKSIAEAIRIDKKNTNTLWQDAIRKEMDNVRIAFELCDGNPKELIGYQEITCHMIFDIKLGENFRRKARYVADGHKTEVPASVTYSSVVSRDSVRICLLIAALNDLEVLGADIQNAYLTAPNREKCWTWAGPEFGSDQGKPYLVVRALYGLKGAGASFRAFLADKLDSMGFKSSAADPEVWLRPAVKADGEEYYEYILCYVDDILAISQKPRDIMSQIQTTFKFKNDAVEPPSIYLGAKLQQKELNGRTCWTMSSVDYINAAVANVEAGLVKKGRKLDMKATTPMNSTIAVELDTSNELDEEGIQYFQELIGILRWATEIGRVDILHEVSLLSQYQAAPREGHLVQALHIFAFLKRKPKLTLYFDPATPQIDDSTFHTKVEDFLDIYRDAIEEFPKRMPQARGRSVTTTAFVDASHAANKVTRRSHSGYIIFVNRAPVMWYSKRQNTVESSTFSSEFIALKVCMESIQALRFKLRMFGVPIDESTRVFCDNESVVNNTSKIESTLNKKHNSISYHYVRWCVAAGIASIGWIASGENLSDAMTKRLSATTRDYLFGNWTY